MGNGILVVTFSCHKVEWFFQYIYISIIWIFFNDVLSFCGLFGVYFMFYTQSTFIFKHLSCLFLVFFPFNLCLWLLIIIFVAFSFVLVVSLKRKYLRMFNQCFFCHPSICFCYFFFDFLLDVYQMLLITIIMAFVNFPLICCSFGVQSCF